MSGNWISRRYTGSFSLGKLCEDHGYNYHRTSGQKPHLIKNGRKISCNTANCVPFVVPGLATSSSSSSSPTSPTSLWQESVTPRSILHQPEVRVWVRNYTETCRMEQQNAKTQIKKTTTRKYEETCRVVCQEWLQEFSERKFFGDTSDHKVLSGGCESRNNHRYAAVKQDLATPWTQSHQCQTKTSQETEWSLQKFLEPKRKPKVIYTDNSLEFGKACEDVSWNHCTSTPHRSETIGVVERAVRRVKEGTSAVLLQSGLGNESWWADSMEVIPICETSQIYYLMGRRPLRGGLAYHLMARLFRLERW